MKSTEGRDALAGRGGAGGLGTDTSPLNLYDSAHQLDKSAVGNGHANRALQSTLSNPKASSMSRNLMTSRIIPPNKLSLLRTAIPRLSSGNRLMTVLNPIDSMIDKRKGVAVTVNSNLELLHHVQ